MNAAGQQQAASPRPVGRIAQTFAALKQRGDKALIAYLVGGDPDPATSLKALKACSLGGADILEIGMPFSDPMSEGVAIQQGHARALQSGMTMHRLFQLVASYRQTDAATPLVLMGYSNPLLAFGQRQFLLRAAQVGVDGLLIVDMPLEEIEELSGDAQKLGLDVILLASPSTSADRLRRIAAASRGYLYYISYKGVTGAGSPDATLAQQQLHLLAADTHNPLAIGFGVRDAGSAARMAKMADAVVVGSALVEYCAVNPVNLTGLRQTVSDLKAAVCSETRVGDVKR